jgi:hypothetical protein
MLVHVAKLLEALHRTLWRHGMVQPERLKHDVHEDGSHTISLTLRASEVEWEAPRHLQRPGLGPSTPPGGDGKKGPAT